MKPSVLYRVAAILLVLFAASHTFGFNQIDPAWKIDDLVGSMKSVQLDMLGSKRSFWDLYLALGYSVGVYYLFAAALAWQLAGLPADTRRRMRLTTWGLALSFVGILAISLGYLFIVPILVSAVIAALLTSAAWLSR